MSEVIKDIADYVAQTSGLEADALASFVKEDGTINEEAAAELLKTARDGFTGKLKSTMTEAEERAQKAWDKKHQQLTADVLTKHEAELRKTIGIEEDLRGEELRKAIAAKLKAPSKGKELTDDDVERHPFFQSMREKMELEAKEKVSQLEQAFEAYKSEVAQKEMFNQVRKQATPLIEKLNPKFDPDSEAVRNDQWDRIWTKLAEHAYDFQEGRTLVLDKEGKVAKDAMGNNLSFGALVEQIVKTTVGVRAAEQREGGGVKNTEKGGEGSAWTKDLPKTKAEFQAAMFDPSIPYAQKKALQERVAREAPDLVA